MTELDDLVGNDLEPGERARLERVHALLGRASPPPELPPALERAPEPPLARVIPFPRRYRYTALSALYQVSGILASGLTPLIAAWLVTRGDGTLGWVAGYNVLVAVISLGSARFLPETRGSGLDRGRPERELEPRESVTV